MTIPNWTPAAWMLLAPFLVVSGGACLLLALDLAFKRRLPWGILSATTLVLALVPVLARWEAPLVEAEQAFGGALRFDNLAVFTTVLILLGGALALVTADGYLDLERHGQRAEFHALALFSVTGMMLLVAAGELMTVFLALELLSFPTYVLCAFRRTEVKSNEAALKYFVLGSFASSLFLYGVSLVWGATGTTVVSSLAAAQESHLLHLGTLFLIAGFLFKIGAAPFHMWVPDVYEGAPTPVTTFMATTVKVAAFGAFLRLLVSGVLSLAIPLGGVLMIVAVATMVVGNFSALTQDNIKRMLAFSSVAHAGYMLVGTAALAVSGWDTGAVAVLYYLAAYVFMNIGAFTVVMLLSRRAEGELQFDRDWSGAARRYPFLGAAMAVFMLSLGGIPPTAGFFGKYSLFKAAVDAHLVPLVVVAVLNSLVSVYYYLRVVVALYMREERTALPGVFEAVAAGTRAHALEGPGAMAATLPPRVADGRALIPRCVVAICLFATLWLGVGASIGRLPGVGRVLDWAELAAAAMR